MTCTTKPYLKLKVSLLSASGSELERATGGKVICPLALQLKGCSNSWPVRQISVYARSSALMHGGKRLTQSWLGTETSLTIFIIISVPDLASQEWPLKQMLWTRVTLVAYWITRFTSPPVTNSSFSFVNVLIVLDGDGPWSNFKQQNGQTHAAAKRAPKFQATRTQWVWRHWCQVSTIRGWGMILSSTACFRHATGWSPSKWFAPIMKISCHLCDLHYSHHDHWAAQSLSQPMERAVL